MYTYRVLDESELERYSLLIRALVYSTDMKKNATLFRFLAVLIDGILYYEHIRIYITAVFHHSENFKFDVRRKQTTFAYAYVLIYLRTDK